MKQHTHIGALPPDVLRVIVDRAAALIVPGTPPIKGGLLLNFTRQGGEKLSLTLPMADGLRLLNALRAIEHEYGLQDWSKQIGTDQQQFDRVWNEIQSL